MALAVTVNGIVTECPPGLSVDELLRRLQLPLDRIAVERNREIVRRDQREWVEVKEGDVFEIVTFVGGG
jgi:thiamine biosynthesis protein ThiS